MSTLKYRFRVYGEKKWIEISSYPVDAYLLGKYGNKLPPKYEIQVDEIEDDDLPVVKRRRARRKRA